jgi:hypothetical protein
VPVHGAHDVRRAPPLGCRPTFTLPINNKVGPDRTQARVYAPKWESTVSPAQSTPARSPFSSPCSRMCMHLKPVVCHTRGAPCLMPCRNAMPTERRTTHQQTTGPHPTAHQSAAPRCKARARKRLTSASGSTSSAVACRISSMSRSLVGGVTRPSSAAPSAVSSRSASRHRIVA